MFRVEFSIVHRGCLVNEMSREFPELRIICPGGFITGDSVEELIVLDKPTEDQVQGVLDYLAASPKVTEVALVERTAERVFILFICGPLPEAFCSRVVQKHHGFPIGMEIQRDGLEIWRVACTDRGEAERLLEEIATLGDLKDSSISQGSWEELLAGRPADGAP